VNSALAVLVSGWVHFSLYFRGGYRGIAPEEVAGLTISRAFAINAIAALVIAEVLVLSLRFPSLRVPAALATVGFAVAALVAYVLVRTVGLLGFTDDRTSIEAVIAVVAEVVALGAGLAFLAGRRRPAEALA